MKRRQRMPHGKGWVGHQLRARTGIVRAQQSLYQLDLADFAGGTQGHPYQEQLPADEARARVAAALDNALAWVVLAHAHLVAMKAGINPPAQDGSPDASKKEDSPCQA